MTDLYVVSVMVNDGNAWTSRAEMWFDVPLTGETYVALEAAMQARFDRPVKLNVVCPAPHERDALLASLRPRAHWTAA